MANDSTEPGESQDTGRRRPPPIIESTATEIGVAPIAADPAPAPGAPPASDTAPEPAEVADQIAIPTADEKADPVTEAAAAAPDGPVPDEPAVGGGGDEPPPFTPAATPAAGSSAWRGMAAGALAAVIVVGIAGAGAYALRPRDPTPDILARLARAEASIADVAAKPAVAPAKVDDIAARLGKAEAKIAEMPAGTGGEKMLTERTDALARRAADTQASLAALDQRLAAAQKTLADIARAEPAKVAELEARVVTAETAVKETRAAIAAMTEPPGLKAVRLAVLAQALDAAVARGTPYAQELAAMRALAVDEAALQPLAPFAASGLPGTPALAAELAQLAPKISAAAAPPSSDQSILAKFSANAEKLVRLRPAGDATGDDAGAVIVRMEAKASRGDFAGSAAEAQKLPADARALVEPWVKRVAARDAARAAAQKLTASSLAAVATAKGPAK